MGGASSSPPIVSSCVRVGGECQQCEIDATADLHDAAFAVARLWLGSARAYAVTNPRLLLVPDGADGDDGEAAGTGAGAGSVDAAPHEHEHEGQSERKAGAATDVSPIDTACSGHGDAARAWQAHHSGLVEPESMEALLSHPGTVLLVYDAPPPDKLKVVVVGNSGVGKTSLIRRLHEDKFSVCTSATIGVGRVEHDVNVDGCRVSLHVWDMAGSERYRAVAPMYFRGSQLAVFCFSLVDARSLEAVVKWHDDALAVVHEDGVMTVLVGTRVDQVDEEHRAAVSPAAIEDVRRRINASFYMATSSKTGVNVHAVFQRAAAQACVRSNSLRSDPSDSTVRLDPHSSASTDLCRRSGAHSVAGFTQRDAAPAQSRSIRREPSGSTASVDFHSSVSTCAGSLNRGPSDRSLAGSVPASLRHVAADGPPSTRRLTVAYETLGRESPALDAQLAASSEPQGEGGESPANQPQVALKRWWQLDCALL